MGKGGQRISSGKNPLRFGLRLSVYTIGGLLALAPVAEARLSTGNYTCSDVKDLVFQQGAIVLNTKNSSSYKRFVANRSFCRGDEQLQRVNVPSKSEKCRLRHCVPRDDNMSN